jgi:hypothetical protein
MFQFKVFVVELPIVVGRRITTIPLAIFKISGLNHEILDHSVENGIFVARSKLAGTQDSEVLNSFWNNRAKETNGDTANRFAILLDVEIYLVCHRWVLW